MAVIPDYRTLAPRQTLQIGSPIATMPQAPGVSDTAQREMQRQMDAADAKEIGDAESAFFMAKSEADNQADEDLDYTTLPDRYREKLDDVIAEASSGISRASARDQFRQKAQLQVLEGYGRVHDIAEVRRKDAEIAEMNDRFVKGREAAIKSGNMVEYGQFVDGQLAVARARGNIDAQQEQELANKMKVDAALGRIDTLPPWRQVQELQASWADKYLPEDTRMVKLRQAQDQARAEADRISQKQRADAVATQAAKWIERQASLNEMHADIRKTKDPLLQARLYNAATAAASQIANARQERRDEFMKRAVPLVASGEMKTRDITYDQWRDATPNDIPFLLKLEAEAAAPAPTAVWDNSAELELIRAKGSGGLGGQANVRQWMETHPEVVKMMPPKKFEEYGGFAYGGADITPPTVKDAEDTLRQRATLNSITDEAKQSRLILNLRDWMYGISDTTGQFPAQSEINNRIDKLLEEVIYSPGVVWDSTMPVGAMDSEQKSDMLAYYYTNNRQLYEETLRRMTDAGEFTTDAAGNKQYDPAVFMARFNALYQGTSKLEPATKESAPLVIEFPPNYMEAEKQKILDLRSVSPLAFQLTERKLIQNKVPPSQISYEMFAIIFTTILRNLDRNNAPTP